MTEQPRKIDGITITLETLTVGKEVDVEITGADPLDVVEIAFMVATHLKAQGRKPEMKVIP